MKCANCGHKVKRYHGKWYHSHGYLVHNLTLKCSNCNCRTPTEHIAIKPMEWFVIKFLNKIKYKLNKKPYYNRFNSNKFFNNLVWMVILSLTFAVIYYNIDKINLLFINGIFPLGNILLLINGIFWIKYTYQMLKGVVYWYGDQRNWIKCLVVLIILSLAWQSYQQKETSIFNPIIDKTNNVSNNFNIVKEVANEIADVQIGIKQPEINISTLEKRIHELIIEKRRQNRLSYLSYDLKLSDIARKHSIDMANKNFFDHDNLNGEDPTARGLKSGYQCYKDYGSYYTNGIAENLFQNNLYDSVTYYNGIPSYDWNTLEEIAQSTVNGWMSSPGHRQNILTSTYDKEGIGIAISSDKKVLITQNFC